jgi:hypothetical protein
MTLVDSETIINQANHHGLRWEAYAAGFDCLIGFRPDGKFGEKLKRDDAIAIAETYAAHRREFSRFATATFDVVPAPAVENVFATC